jgi:trehalose 6-phosphate phosphatase
VYESGVKSDNSDLARRVTRMLASGRAGLITDVDGTIAPIVMRPEDARVLPRAREALEQLNAAIDLVAVVSGRQVADARAMVGVDAITYVGNHGLEMWGPDGPMVLPEARPWIPRLAHVLDDIKSRIQHTGIRVENKGVTASLHYRSADEPEQARRELLEILAHSALTSGLRLEAGRMVLNLLPPLTVSKGSAVNWLVRQHQLKTVVYLGDDVTDAHAFRALKALEEHADMHTLSIGVIGPETPFHVRQLADQTVPSVDAVADLLCATVIGLRAGGRMGVGSSEGPERSA